MKIKQINPNRTRTSTYLDRKLTEQRFNCLSNYLWVIFVKDKGGSKFHNSEGIKLNIRDSVLRRIYGSSACVMQWTGFIRDGTLIEKDIWRFLSIVFALERTNQLSLLPDKDLVNLCPPIEPYQVTKNRIYSRFICKGYIYI